MKFKICMYALAGTKDFFQYHKEDGMEVEVIKVMKEAGTDIFFAISEEGNLIYFTPTCITKFL